MDNEMDMEVSIMKKKNNARLYTVDRVFSGSRTAEELVSDIIRAHAV